MSTSWKTSVTELLAIFKGALLSIIPWLEKAKIKWKENEAYDDWDNIAESLFSNIVCSSLIGEVSPEYDMAKYNFYYNDYTSINFIEVRDKENFEKKFAFVAFRSDFSPLDNIKVAELDKMNKVIKYTNLKFDNLKFVFVKNLNGEKEVIDNIEVRL